MNYPSNRHGLPMLGRAYKNFVSPTDNSKQNLLDMRAEYLAKLSDARNIPLRQERNRALAVVATAYPQFKHIGD